MKDYFLRADSREQIDQALQSAGILDYVDGAPKANVAIDYVDKVTRPTGIMLADEEGNEYEEMEVIEGYHVNIRGTLTPEQEALLPIIDNPDNPYRIFAGGVLR